MNLVRPVRVRQVRIIFWSKSMAGGLDAAFGKVQ